MCGPKVHFVKLDISIPKIETGDHYMSLHLGLETRDKRGQSSDIRVISWPHYLAVNKWCRVVPECDNECREVKWWNSMEIKG